MVNADVLECWTLGVRERERELLEPGGLVRMHRDGEANHRNIFPKAKRPYEPLHVTESRIFCLDTRQACASTFAESC